ncbi:MAG TPA: hypothetical protein VKB80_09940, partial [Kofleriaceae bacterium]|nr:hypothetical protein [Kofleriaceae bacterium]
LLGRDGVARVSDFGVARIVGEAGGALPEDGVDEEGSVTRTGGVGTAGYIAPEILRHQPADGRADQFSLCVALHAGLHGERPFAPLDGTRRLAETLGEPRAPRRRVAPRWLQRIVLRGLAADPRDRWPSMAALASAIERGLGRRRRAIAVAVAAPIAVAVAAVVAPTRPAPAPAPDWSPVVIARDSGETPELVALSPDGTTLATITPSVAWVEPRDGAGPRRRVHLPLSGQPALCRLSRAGELLFCSFQVPGGGFEIWAVDVVTGRAARRAPPSAAPALRPMDEFDVDSDGRVLFPVAGGNAAWWVDRTGAARRAVTAEAPDKIVQTVWSPDGARIALNIVSPAGDRLAIASTGSGAVEVVSRRRCQAIGWLTARSLVCAQRNTRNVVLVELLLAAGGGAAEERVRYDGPEYQSLAWFHSSPAGVLFGSSGVDMHMGLLALDPPGEGQKVRPISSGGITDLPAAGWTSSGSLIFGAHVQGHLRIMRRLPDGAIETARAGAAAEVPLAVLGETILFGRFPGGETTIPFIDPPIGRRYPDGELFRLVPGAAPRSLGRTRGFLTLLCAGGRAPPCLLAEHSGDDAIAIDWDPETGARGRERARWSLTTYGGRSGSLSPDGHTLAQVQRFFGNGEISLLDLTSADQRRRRVALPGAYFWGTGWQSDGTLVAMTTRPRRHPPRACPRR